LFDGLSAAEVLADADRAMYEAKAMGRDRFAMYRRGGDRKEPVSGWLAEAGAHLQATREGARAALHSVRRGAMRLGTN